MIRRPEPEAETVPPEPRERHDTGRRWTGANSRDPRKQEQQVLDSADRSLDNTIPVVSQQLVSGVSLRYQDRWFWPGDIENRIQRVEACFGIWVVGGTV